MQFQPETIKHEIRYKITISINTKKTGIIIKFSEDWPGLQSKNPKEQDEIKNDINRIGDKSNNNTIFEIVGFIKFLYFSDELINTSFLSADSIEIPISSDF